MIRNSTFLVNSMADFQAAIERREIQNYCTQKTISHGYPVEIRIDHDPVKQHRIIRCTMDMGAPGYPCLVVLWRKVLPL